jgi:hypothetical protein
MRACIGQVARMDILEVKGRPGNAATLAVRRTFFLVVSMASTTFASFDKLFGGLGCEALGWLFVDEAGQAPPQYAVVASRSKSPICSMWPSVAPSVVSTSSATRDTRCNEPYFNVLAACIPAG